MTQFSIDRRSLFKGAGALIVSIGIPGAVATAEIGSAVKPPLSPDWLDSWLAVKADGDVVAYFGKMEMGQGVDVAIAQIVADELDVPFERVNVVMGDTAWTVNQGGASGSTGIHRRQRIAEQLDREWELIRYKGADFNNIFAGLNAGTYDCIASGTTITPDREQIVDFCPP